MVGSAYCRDEAGKGDHNDCVYWLRERERETVREKNKEEGREREKEEDRERERETERNREKGQKQQHQEKQHRQTHSILSFTRRGLSTSRCGVRLVSQILDLAHRILWSG
jgi:hypothetical protein